MNKILPCILLYLFLPQQAWTQLHPEEGSRLHYRLIGFSFPQVKNTLKYTVEIADGNYTSEQEFDSHIIQHYTTKTNKLIGEVPSFGMPYTWRITHIAPDKTTQKSRLYHFSTNKLPCADTQYMRLRIIKKAAKYSEAFVFCDKNRVLYDMNGSPVWYMPDLPGRVNEKTDVRDIKLSPKGTLTFIADNMAYEMNYDGEVLWQPPNDGKINGDSIEHYHHQMTMLGNGNYMILGNELVAWEWRKSAAGDAEINLIPKPLQGDTSKVKVYSKLLFGTVIEYDTSGNILWSWKSSDYFKKTELIHRKAIKNISDSHENAFFLDEQHKNLYVSFKNFSRILKIGYPTGKVSHVYGNTTDSVMPLSTPFCHQHSCNLSRKGYIYLFNNNICHPDVTPKVVMLQEPVTETGSLKKIWEYSYPYKGDFTKRRIAEGTSGGNVIELPGGEMFVSMCNPYSNVFIVNQNKQLLWDAVLEQWNMPARKWDILSSYRCSIILNRKKMDQLIWSEDVRYKQ